MKTKICIIQSVYNEDITDKLSYGANEELKNSGINKADIVKVPGAFEIPGTITRLVKKYDGFIAIGCVIKGETPHFDFISSASTQAIMNLAVESKKPIGNGIITCLNMKQAKDRGKKGKEAAKAVISVLSQ